jgi:hAT family C-terminal dimerisation region
LQEGIADDSENEAKEGAQKEKIDIMINIEFEYYKSLKTLEITEGTTEKGVDAFSNPLISLKMHQILLPLLSTLASRILCIPATSATSKRVFSTAGRERKFPCYDNFSPLINFSIG